MNGILTELIIDKSLDIKTLQDQAKKNIKEAKMELAKRLLIGEGVKRNIDVAKNILEDLVVGDTGEANYILGKLYLEKVLTNDNPEFGLKKIETASSNGYEKATLFLAFSALSGINGVPKNIDVADKNMRRLALDGNFNAMFELGKLYENGIENKVQPDNQEAVRWYLQACEGGIIPALNRLGYIYYFGSDEVSIDLVKAVYYWELELKEEDNQETLSMISYAYIKMALQNFHNVKNINEKDQKVLNILKNIE
jgi:TPR repeat protein